MKKKIKKNVLLTLLAMCIVFSLMSSAVFAASSCPDGEESVLSGTDTAASYTAKLLLYPSNGLSIDAIKNALTAKGIACTAYTGYVKLDTAQEVSEEDFLKNSGLKSMDNVAAAELLNTLFFGAESLISPTSMTGYSCRKTGANTQVIDVTLCDAPGVTVEPDKTKPVKLTVVNQNGDDQEQVVEGRYFVNSTIYPLRDFVGSDPDDPITAWCSAVRNPDGTLTVSQNAIPAAIRLTGDTIIVAVHNAPKNYVRMVMIGNNDRETDLINKLGINETPQGIYTPQAIPGTRASLDMTVNVSVTKYEVLAKQYRGILPGEENTKYLKDLLIANSLMSDDSVIYSAHPIEYWHFTNADKQTINVTTFIISLASLHKVSFTAVSTEGQPLDNAELPQALSNVPFETALSGLVSGKQAVLSGYEFLRWEYNGDTIDQASVKTMPAEDIVFTAVLKKEPALSVSETADTLIVTKDGTRAQNQSSPKTGDELSWFFWMTLLAMSGVGSLLLLVLRGKGKRIK